MTRLIPAATVRLGQWLTYSGLSGRVTAIEHGPNIGIWLSTTGDMRWLINADTEVSVTT